MHPPYRLVLLALLLQLACSEIIQVIVVHRHGARPHLAKHATDPSNEEASEVPGITRGGVTQISALGGYIRDTYTADGSESRIRGFHAGAFRRHMPRAMSSNTPRTLVSSRVMLNAIWGTEDGAVLPTKVFGDLPDDWIIRGYAVCPNLDNRLRDFANSDDFIRKRDDRQETDLTNEEFVIKLASKLREGQSDQADDQYDLHVEDDQLEDVFNVYDRYLMIQNDFYTTRQRNGTTPEKLNDADFRRLRELADWYESSRYNYATHEIQVAGGLVAEIIDLMKNATMKERVPERRRLVLFSAHYPTLLTVLATLRSRGDPGADPANKIPGFAAALFFEVHREGEGSGRKDFVKLKWYEGDDDWRTVTAADVSAREIAVGEEPCLDPSVGCPMKDFIRLFEEDAGDERSFCDACGSTAAVCLRINSQCGIAEKWWVAVLGIFVGVLMVTLVHWWRKRARNKKSVHVMGNTRTDEISSVFGDGRGSGATSVGP